MNLLQQAWHNGYEAIDVKKEDGDKDQCRMLWNMWPRVSCEELLHDYQQLEKYIKYMKWDFTK